MIRTVNTLRYTIQTVNTIVKLNFLTQIFCCKTPTKIFTALCFKAPPKNLCNSTEGAGWISLIDDFFNYANDIINSKQLNVEFILVSSLTRSHLR